MKRFAIVSALALSFVAMSVHAEEKTVTGTLIDQMCAKKVMKSDDAQAAADKHEKACAAKCGKKSGFAVISDGKEIKLDKASNDKIEEYLGKDDASTKVTVKGDANDKGVITVSSIEAAK